ncbi:hypothetical protein OIO90_004567 [Microbotryomycetes sp. JL221]|nr:hypothetical protein OIO90_004567 [Microbotryomycetes sp. JL221]
MTISFVERLEHGEPVAVATAVAIIALLYIVPKLASSGKREPGLPPGPKTIPVLGNLHQMPLEHAHFQMTKWAKEYGPIFSLKLGNATMVVLTGASEVKELMDRRSATTSDRPPLHVANELITNGKHLLAMGYSARWRLVRKILHQYLTIRMCEEKHQFVQSAESTQMIWDVLNKPDDYYNRVRRYSTGVILSIVYGRRGPTWEGPVSDIYSVMDPWSEIVETGATPPVDIFPFFKKLPDFVSPWRKKALRVRQMELDLYGRMAQEVRDRRAKGINRGSLMDQVLDSQASGADPLLDDEQIAYVGGVLLEGGSDTTSSLTLSFILACCAFPEVLKKAQQEVDRVCGRDRMPDFDDFENLPYIRMCVKETQRWRPVVVMSFPHCTTKDESFRNYVLPKGTTLLCNTWGLHHDPERFPEPNKFMPERYKDFPLSAPEYAAMAGDDVRDHYGYGSGRRICVGLHIAERSMYLNIARLCWAFNITEDPAHPVNIDNYSPGFLIAPKAFKCKIVPRDDKVRSVVASELETAGSVFREYED